MAFYVVQLLACRQHSIDEKRLVNSAKEVMFLLSLLRLLFGLCGSVIAQRAVDEFLQSFSNGWFLGRETIKV